MGVRELRLDGLGLLDFWDSLALARGAIRPDAATLLVRCTLVVQGDTIAYGVGVYLYHGSLESGVNVSLRSHHGLSLHLLSLSSRYHVLSFITPLFDIRRRAVLISHEP